MIDFQAFPKIARLSRECVITEKIDGTNASIYISDDASEFLTGSKSRWITPGKTTDNCGFARWAQEHKDELMQLGPGHHFGEWWGSGIQRGYRLQEKRFSLFNTARWSDASIRPACCGVVPVLYAGPFSTVQVQMALDLLKQYGSYAAPGFMNPEGVVIYHEAAKMMFKKTILNDEKPKGSGEQA